MVKTPNILKLLYPHFEWDIRTNNKKIYLTFDDGPIPEVTPFVLDTLKQFGAKATFFCIGDNIRKYPGVFQQVIDEGHAIGNHTFNHLNGWKTEDDERYGNNVRECQGLIDEFYAHDGKKLFRPPYGRIRRRQAAPLLETYRIIMWSVLTKDYDAGFDRDVCLSKSIRATENGSIVLFHDSLKASKNMMYVLPRFLSHFSEKGYTFDKL